MVDAGLHAASKVRLARRCGGGPLRRASIRRAGSRRVASRVRRSADFCFLKAVSPVVSAEPLALVIRETLADREEEAADAAAAFLRRVAGLGSEASLHDVEKVWDSRQPLVTNRSTRRVCFDLEANTIHEITPYEELYGLHPREFVFGRNFCMIPAGGDYGFVDFLTAHRRALRAEVGHYDSESDEDIDSDSDEEDWC